MKRAIALLGCVIAALASGAYAQDDVHVRKNSSTFLTQTPGYNTTVLSVQLPAGQWVLSSRASLVNFGPSDYTRCQLVSNDIQVGAATAFIGSDSTFVSTIAITGAFSSDDVATVELRCGHDVFSSNPPYVDPHVTIWAHRSNDLQIIELP